MDRASIKVSQTCRHVIIKLPTNQTELLSICFDTFFFFYNIFLFKMLVTFLLQKPKLLMKYFILIFSYIIKILSNNII